MTTAPLRLAPEGERNEWPFYTNPIVRMLTGIAGAGILLRGHDGTRRDPETNVSTSGHYLIDAQDENGLHAAFVLSGTAADADPAPDNSVLLVEDDGAFIGAGKALRLYDVAGTDYASLSSDADGGLVLGGSGANAGNLGLTNLTATLLKLNTPVTSATIRTLLQGQEAGADRFRIGLDASDLFVVLNAGGSAAALTVDPATGNTTTAGTLTTNGTTLVRSGNAFQLNNAANTAVAQLAADASGNLVVGGTTSNLQVNGNIAWLSGTANLLTLDHAASSARTATFQDLTGTVALLGAANVGNLIFADNAHDIGASGATRPRDLFLARNAVIGGDLTLTGGLTWTGGTWTTFTPAIAQGVAAGTSAVVGEYQILGKTAILHVEITTDGTGGSGAGNVINITGIPSAIQPARTGFGAPIGVFTWWRSGVAFYHGYAYAPSATTISGTAYAATNAMGANSPSAALANNDVVSCTCTYKIA